MDIDWYSMCMVRIYRALRVGFEPITYWSEVPRTTHSASPVLSAGRTMHSN